MSLSTNVADLATRVATEAKSLRTLINGNALDLSALTTTAKSSLVAAINELALAIGGAGASIEDGTASTLTVWSSSKTDAEIDAAVSALVSAAPGTLDTLNELAAALGDDPAFATTITNALASKAPLNSPAFTGTPTGITKAHVGLGNVDNTTDAAKPISTATATALAGKASSTHTHVIANITDSTAVGRALVTAASAGAALTAIGGAPATDVGNTATDYVSTFEAGLA